jgi:hypothetical protein
MKIYLVDGRANQVNKMLFSEPLAPDNHFLTHHGDMRSRTAKRSKPSFKNNMVISLSGGFSMPDQNVVHRQSTSAVNQQEDQAHEHTEIRTAIMGHCPEPFIN